tara:strand:- start:544 stop:1860 length:1317 start_codon:yes stop_codon:yes gene_type:complete
MIKEQDFLKDIASYCIENSKKLGATEVGVKVIHSVSENVSFRNKKLDESNRSDSFAINLTTYIDKKKSSINSSDLSKSNLEKLIERCIDATKITPIDENNSLPDKDLMSKKMEDLQLYDETHYSNDKKIEFLEQVEDAASLDDKIVNTESGFTENKNNFVLANSNGFQNGYKTSNFSSSCVAVSRINGTMERDYEFGNKRFLNDMLKPDEIGKIAAEKAINKLGPKKIDSEKIGIIFDKRISKGILSTLASAVSASAISRGTSFLKNKIDNVIFPSSINIIDDPKIQKGIGSQNFDSEGVENNSLKLVENGILKNYLIDTYYGKKLNLKSNGRSGGTTNLYFENGNLSFKELLNLEKKFLYITETIGHGGNIITGDYSVGASGFMVENGELTYPVSEITIAGNFKEMFKNLILANDLEMKYSTNAPTLLINEMTVAGK